SLSKKSFARRQRNFRSGRSPLTAYRRSAVDIPMSESVVPIERLFEKPCFSTASFAGLFSARCDGTIQAWKAASPSVLLGERQGDPHVSDQTAAVRRAARVDHFGRRSLYFRLPSPAARADI